MIFFLINHSALVTVKASFLKPSESTVRLPVVVNGTHTITTASLGSIRITVTDDGEENYVPDI